MNKTKSHQPRIRPEPLLIDRLLDALVLGINVGLWVFTLKAYPRLPVEIVIHFDAYGNPDGYGGKWNLFILPALANLLSIGIFVLNLYPYIFNFPVKITPENAIYQYRLTTRLMRWTNLLISLLFAIIIWMMIKSYSGSFNKAWMVVILIYASFLFIPFVVYLALAGRKK